MLKPGKKLTVSEFQEAEQFLLGFTQLWDLIPDYPEAPILL